MKANEFVKNFGITRAHQILKYSNHKHKRFLADRISVTYNEMDIPDWTSLDDLKRLVESHELVESYGGLEKSRKHLDEKWVFEWTALDGKLSQSICDVESCK